MAGVAGCPVSDGPNACVVTTWLPLVTRTMTARRWSAVIALRTSASMPDACGDCAPTVVDCRAFAAGAGDEHDVSAIASAMTVAAARPVALMGHRHPIPGFPAISPFLLRATALHLRVPANVIMGQLISPRKTPRLSDAEMARPEK